MKAVYFSLLGLALASLSSCSRPGLADQAILSKSAMSFDQEGADVMACGLVSQLETGRASDANAAGGGCASCH